MSHSSNPQQNSLYPSKWWQKTSDGRFLCTLCPRDCKLKPGQRGACFVRLATEDGIHLTTWGRSSGFCIDPIEKKPLAHFYPGSSVLSFGTAGCNLACRFCQNWDISKSSSMDRLQSEAPPQAIASIAQQAQCTSVAYTYNDPIIFLEYAVDTAQQCRQAGIYNVAVSAGYVHPEPRQAFFSVMDAANIDLKAFTNDFYAKLCAAELEPVLDTLRYIYHDTSCWLEITTLIIPGYNDSDQEIQSLAHFIVQDLGANVPLHLSAFHPDWRMRDTPATPASTLIRLRKHALACGLNHVYIGNVVDQSGSATTCPQCRQTVIQRLAYDITVYDLDDSGRCKHCHQSIAGHFKPFSKSFGNRRIPIKISRR